MLYYSLFLLMDTGVVRMAYGAVGSTYVVGLLPTLEFDAGSTLDLEGGMLTVCSGIHLSYLGVWCSVITLVSERVILQWFHF